MLGDLSYDTATLQSEGKQSIHSPTHTLSAHNLWRRLARPRARAYWKHGRFDLISVSSVSWKMATAYQRARTWNPPFSSHFNQRIITLCEKRLIWFLLPKTEYRQVNINVESRPFGVIVTPFSRQRYIAFFDTNFVLNPVHFFFLKRTVWIMKRFHCYKGN